MNDHIRPEALHDRTRLTRRLVIFGAMGIILVIAAFSRTSFLRAQERSRWTACHSNLRMIDAVKWQAVLELDLAPRSTVPTDTMLAYMYGGKMVTCPAGGRYRMGVASEEPRCSLHGGLCDDPIHMAAAMGDVAEVRKQLADHYSVDQESHDKWTPLHFAAFGNQLGAVDFLLSGGADPNSRTRFSETPADLATEPKVLSLLRQHGGTQSSRPSDHGAAMSVTLKKTLSLVLNREFAPPNQYKFHCRLVNTGDKRIRLKVVESSVAMETVLRNGGGVSGSSSSLGELCPSGTEIVLEPTTEYPFDWWCEHTVSYTLRDGKVVSESTTHKTATGSGSGTGSVSGGPSVAEMNDSTSVRAFAFVHAEMEGAQPVELSLWSERCRYLVKDPPEMNTPAEEPALREKGVAKRGAGSD